jgi:MoaA/NifB/PqqE/SkfB family radical SAM enzyme
MENTSNISLEQLKKNTVCAKPWTAISITTSGHFTPCCQIKKKIKDSRGNFMQIESNSLDEALQSKDMEQFREQFKANEKPKECYKCWQHEAVDKDSLRIKDWQQYFTLKKHLVQKDIKKIISLQINWGNLCNLKCRICSYEYSSKWGNELINLKKIEKKTIKNYNDNAVWPKKHKKNFFTHLQKILPSLLEIENAGGEPLLVNEHQQMLEMCVAKGFSKNITLTYSTNGTVLPTHIIKNIWPKFKRVKVNLSIDDVEKRFEYSRHPANWQQVKKNMQTIKELKSNNVQLLIGTTVSVFNILYLDKLLEFVREFQPDAWWVNTVEHPYIFDIRSLPRSTKYKILEKYKNFYHVKSIRDCVNLIKTTIDKNSQDTDKWRINFFHEINLIDKIRKENFANTFPELYSLIQ